MARNRRVYQIGERIRELVAEHLIQSADPRFTLVTITSVMVSPDLGLAKVYWVVSFTTGMDRDARINEVQEAFEGAQGHLRHIIAKQLGIRFVPHLRFFYDDTLDTVEQVEKLMGRIKGPETP